MGLVGQWWLRSNRCTGVAVHDDSGYGNDGTAANAPVFTTDHNGVANGAMTFNGISDLINCGNDASLQFPAGLSVSAWIRTSADGCVGQRLHDAVDEGIWLFRVIAGKMQFLVSNNSLGNISAVNSTAHVDDNAWHHVVGTTDRTTMRMYIDSGADGTANDTSTDTLGSSGEDLSIGVRLPAAAWFDGSMSDRRIYNRELTPTEITRIFNETQIFPAYTPSLRQVNGAGNIIYAEHHNQLRNELHALMHRIAMPVVGSSAVIAYGADGKIATITTTNPAAVATYDWGREKLNFIDAVFDAGELDCTIRYNYVWPGDDLLDRIEHDFI